MTTNNPPIAAWAPSTALAKLASRHNNAPCVLTDGPAEFNDVALVRLADYQRLQAEAERLQAECEKLRKDAERYQFVRTRVSASNARGPASWAFHYYQLPKPISNPLAGPPAWVHFDAAIDAAMQEENK